MPRLRLAMIVLLAAALAAAGARQRVSGSLVAEGQETESS